MTRVPIVEISLFTGRTPQQKLHVARAISDALVAHADARPDTVQVIFRDVERGDWVRSDDMAGAPQDR